MSKHTFESDWTIGDRVHIDGDQSIKVGIRFAAVSHDAIIEWIHDGKSVQATIDLFRLSAAE
jgi:hypothetical protein